MYEIMKRLRIISDSSSQFLEIGSEQIKTVQTYSYECNWRGTTTFLWTL